MTLEGFMYAVLCLGSLYPEHKCPGKYPVSSYQLNHFWNPTNPYLSDSRKDGYWTKSKDKMGPDLRMFVGKQLRIALIEEPNFVTNLNGTFNGTAKRIIDVLQKRLGFNYKIVTPKDNCVGIYHPNNHTWTGILGMLKNNEADFSVQYISMLPIRTLAINFSAPLGEERWVVMMERPRETTDGEGLVAPFHPDVWYCLLVALIIMGPFCWIMVKARCRACRSHPLLSIPYSVGSCIWFVYGALMKQGSVLKPVADSTRILFATWWIFVTILTAFYTANLTAYLTLSKVPIPFDSLEKIGYRDKYITRKGDAIEQILRLKETVSNATAGTKFYKTEIPYKEFYKLRYYGEPSSYGYFTTSWENMTDFVKSKHGLMLDEQSRVERTIYRDFRKQSDNPGVRLAERCSFIMSRNPILRVPYGFAFVNATIRDVFKPVLTGLSMGGLFDHWKRLNLPVKDPCSADSDFRERQLRNGDLRTTYLLCTFGYSLAFLSFIVELVTKYFGNKKVKRKLIPTDKGQLSFYKGNLTVPQGAPTYFDTEKFLKNINGRNYIVMKTADGRTRLVPKSDGTQALQPVYQPPPLISFGYMS